MGNSLDRLAGYEDSSPDSTVDCADSRKRRKTDPTESPPKKITKLDTAKYVYERLFLQGEGSDVTVHAVGHVWHLHKLYLQQCKYFEVLMQGNWKDSKEDVIYLDFPDENVTREGLHAVLGSLYHNQIELDLDNAEGVLSAASVLQLESVLERCGDAMADNLSANNVLRYLNLAEMYGLPQVTNRAYHLLKWNFWRFMKSKEHLKDLKEDTFVRLISSSELLIMEGEMDVYQMIKTWIFLKEKPHAAALPDSDFARQMNETFASFPEGQLFVRHAGLFAALRLHHITTTLASLTAVENDKLIPKEVLRAVMVDQWKTALTNEENPTAVNELSMDDFHVNALRLGRLIDNMPKCWRWTGFNNGVDIVMSMSHGYSHLFFFLNSVMQEVVRNLFRVLTMKRNCLSQATPYSINLKSERVVHYRAIISDSSGVCLFDSTKQSTVLRLDQSVVVARLGDDLTLPISVHLLYLAAQPAPPSFLYVNQYIKDMVRKEDEGETVCRMSSD
ncbi:BTB/POZ domain protein [Ancylostoma caninum]|uniref:BTB/POZ domain protein n=1 Tax=Ancylostoma caninum TaxID=29170 RepID=A0A368FSS1_ANCCA|nr:BTB/POZ domain protein [Ancylostoma caninum]